MRRRDKPLDACPRLDCRRAGICHSETPDTDCRKLFMTMEERYSDIIAVLQKVMAESGTLDRVKIPLTPEEEQKAMAECYYIVKEVAQNQREGRPPDAKPRRRRKYWPREFRSSGKSGQT